MGVWEKQIMNLNKSFPFFQQNYRFLIYNCNYLVIIIIECLKTWRNAYKKHYHGYGKNKINE